MRKRLMMLLLIAMSTLVLASPVLAKGQGSFNDHPSPGTGAPWSGQKGGGN